MPAAFTRRSFVAGAALGSVSAFAKSLRAPDYTFYEVVKYVSMTNHMWSGFNQLAHLPTGKRLSATSRL